MVFRTLSLCVSVVCGPGDLSACGPRFDRVVTDVGADYHGCFFVVPPDAGAPHFFGCFQSGPDSELVGEPQANPDERRFISIAELHTCPDQESTEGQTGEENAEDQHSCGALGRSRVARKAHADDDHDEADGYHHFATPFEEAVEAPAEFFGELHGLFSLSALSDTSSGESITS